MPEQTDDIFETDNLDEDDDDGEKPNSVDHHPRGRKKLDLSSPSTKKPLRISAAPLALKAKTKKTH